MHESLSFRLTYTVGERVGCVKLPVGLLSRSSTVAVDLPLMQSLKSLALGAGVLHRGLNYDISVPNVFATRCFS